MSVGYSKAGLESAVLGALAPLSVQGGGYVRVLDLYRGGLTEEGCIAEAMQLPAIFVSYASSAYRPGGYMHAYETLGFNVVAVGRTGNAPGVYRMLEDIRDILCGSTLGLDVMPMKLVRESSLFCSKETTAFTALYSLTQGIGLPAQG